MIVSSRFADAQAREFFRANPANTRDVMGPYRTTSAAEYDAAVLQAQAAAVDWGRRTPAQRGALIARAAAWARQNADSIARELTREEGKTLAEARAEILGAAATMEYIAAGAHWYEGGHLVQSARPGVLLYTRRYPLGVVGLITPWNFPFSNPALKIASALMAGDAAVWKPSPWTPATALALARSYAEADLPPGVLSTLLDDSHGIGERIAADERVTAISFTGSTATGRRIQSVAATRGVPVQLEMGGKNAVVVLKDADSMVPEAVASGAFLSAGQKCTAVSRVIVERSAAAAFTESLVTETRQLVVGDPFDDRTQVSPLVHERQLAKVLAAIDHARSGGARVIAGGARCQGQLADGHFLEPTILAVDSSDLPIVREEVFGPVLCLLIAEDYPHALNLANQSKYGLAAGIFTRDMAKAMHFADHCDVGTVKINDVPPGGEFHVPTGGWKESGAGPKELGPRAIEFFSREKTISLNPLLP